MHTDGSEHVLHEKVLSTRKVGNTNTDVIQKTYQWDTAYYKVTPLQISNAVEKIEGTSDQKFKDLLTQ